MAVAIRYVEAMTGTVHEHILTYVEASSLTAESLTMYLIETLRKYSLDPKYIVIDELSGRCSGVQERLREFAPHAVYIHCYAHNLNLALVDREEWQMLEFFQLLEALYVFMSTTKAHALFLKKQKDLHPDRFANYRDYQILGGHVVRVQ